MASTASRTPSPSSRRPAKIAARERLEIRLTGQRRVEWLEASGRGEQQLPGVPASCAREGDLRAQAFETRSLKVVEGPELGGREQRGCRVGRAGVELRLRCGESTRSPATGIGRQLDRPREERGSSRDPAARERPVGGALELVAPRPRRGPRRHARGATPGGRDRCPGRSHRPALDGASRRSVLVAARYAAERTSG